MSFLPTSPLLARALVERNYTQPTPVQAAVLTDDVVDRDLLVSAQTGLPWPLRKIFWATPSDFRRQLNLLP